MPDLVTHTEIAKPIIGGGTSFFAGLLLEYLGVTTPIFVAASFGAVIAVVMLGKFKPIEAFGITLPPAIVALLVSFTGGIAACYCYNLIKPLVGLTLDQAPATAVLAFILVYFLPLILEVIKNRLEGLKK
jgi:drug/metabolite transporter (DMT)-like permease